MAEEGSEAGGPVPELTHEDYVDLADRCERMIDKQFETVEAIDSKAEYVTRLVVLVLGVLFTGGSVLTQIDGDVGTASTAALACLGLGVVAMVAAMLFAIVTYLSSKLKIGFEPSVPKVLGNRSVTAQRSLHVQHLVGTYGYAMEVNRQVLQQNARRFRYALSSLAAGVMYFSSAAGLFLLELEGGIGWLIVAVTTFVVSAILWYVRSGRYLTAPSQ